MFGSCRDLSLTGMAAGTNMLIPKGILCTLAEESRGLMEPREILLCSIPSVCNTSTLQDSKRVELETMILPIIQVIGNKAMIIISMSAKEQ